jgi:proline-specific peptidase
VRTQEGYIEVPGGKVFYRIVGEGGVPLLCLHGGPGLPHDYLEALEDLSSERPVIFYDQLGCGNSERPDDHSLWNVERFVEELATVREALGLERLHLFGNSWGGWLAMQYVLDRRPFLESLVLSSSPPSVPRWIEDCAHLREQLPQEVKTTLDHHEEHGYFDCPEYQWAIVFFYRRHLCRMNPWPEGLERAFSRFGADVYNTMWGPSEFGPVTGMLKSWDITERLSEIKVPTLITGGRYDEARPDHLEILHQCIEGSEMVIFEESAHLAFAEERKHYIQVLGDFLDSVEGRS